MSSTLARPDTRLSDALWATQGVVYLSGTQALVRLPLMQSRLDAARGLQTRGFVSGYRGSPLGMVDQQIWQAGPAWQDAGLSFVPAINEELAATQVLGTQRVESDPARLCQGVFAMWYGKGPGVDRAGDALKHGNAYGSSPHGGVLVVAGDDHGCVSSSMPHQSDQLMQAYHMPIVSPANIAEHLEFGLYAWALSRFSGNWVGMTSLSEVVECSATVDLEPIQAHVAAWHDGKTVQALTHYQPPAQGLHYRWPDFPSLTIEARLADKLQAVAAFARVNSIDRTVIDSSHARIGIITCGKAHYDVLEVLRRLQISPTMLADAGLRLYKVGLSFPLESTRVLAFAQGLEEIMVVEEKGGVVEQQLHTLLYHLPTRPHILGKQDAQGRALISATGELRPSRLMAILAAWLSRHFPAQLQDRCAQVTDFTAAALLSNAADSVKRQPYFCAGCPHNTSTQIPQGSTAQAGIGCHFMANWMERHTAGAIQMGGEGVDWVAHSLYTKTPHVFQNLGDGTYYHSGYLAIRQAVAAKTHITYKILFNDAVAMTGGQPVGGDISVDAIARQVASEGVKKVVVVSDNIGPYAALRSRFPANTRFHDRSELDAVQRELRATPGVTVLIYAQTCAAEKRRRRKKGSLHDPAKRLFIYDAVCEGCGDCTVQSNCVAVLPKATPLGRKRQIDQTACNKDYSCVQGFCPSFVGVIGAQLRKKAGALGLAEGAARLQAMAASLPTPAAHRWQGPYDLLITGVGGTGVVTVGALVAVAAHLDGNAASVLDFTGFAQKGGAVLSFVRLADQPARLNQVRIDTQQADAVLACDTVVAAQSEALQTVRTGRTRILVNVHETPATEFLRHPDAQLHTPLLLAKLRHAAGPGRVETFDAQQWALDFLGDTVTANVLALGYAWQRGLVPVSLAALERAIELNNVAVTSNVQALTLGRLAAAAPQALNALLYSTAATEQTQAGGPGLGPGLSVGPGHPTPTLHALCQHAQQHLSAYQNAAWAQRFQASVDAAMQAERAWGQDPEDEQSFTRSVAHSLWKLMSYKDEYEVARLYSDAAFLQALRDQFSGQWQLEFYLAPPLWVRAQGGQPPKKRRYGAWILPLLRLLALGKVLRGTRLDPFAYSAERRNERASITRYEQHLQTILSIAQQHGEALSLVKQWARLPLSVRGYGHVKARNAQIAETKALVLMAQLQKLDTQRTEPASAPEAHSLQAVA